MPRNLALALMLLVGAIPLSADQSPAAPRSSEKFGALRRAQPPDLYRKLFDVQTTLNAAVEQWAAKSPPKPLVMCGTTLLPGDPNIDPQIYVGSSHDGTPRRVPPPSCHPTR